VGSRRRERSGRRDPFANLTSPAMASVRGTRLVNRRGYRCRVLGLDARCGPASPTLWPSIGQLVPTDRHVTTPRLERPELKTPRNWTRATLGDAVRVGDPIMVWCNNRACDYWQEHGNPYRAVVTAIDLAAYAERYGVGTTFVEFRARLRCRHCGSGDVSTMVDSRAETPAERWEREAREGEP
jgi:hypothetical protein